MDVRELNVLKATVRHVGGIDDSKDVWAHHRLDEDLGFDSLDTAELAINLEESFGVTLADADVQGWRTVADAIGTVGAALNRKEGVTA